MSMFYEQARPGGSALATAGFIATVIVHVAVAAGILGTRSCGPSTKDIEASSKGEFVDVQAVKFGKPRDLSFLPHKAPPKVDAPKPTIKLSDNAAALPRPPDEKKPDKKDETLDKLKSLADKLKTTDDSSTGSKEITEEGDPNGLKGGSSTVGRGPIYYQHLVAAVQNAWSIPTIISDDELSHLKAKGCIKIDALGHITSFSLDKPSGNERFDATLLEAFQSIKDFEAPPSDLRAQLADAGVCMNFSKTR